MIMKRGAKMGAYLMLGGTDKAPTIKGGSTESTHTDWILINSWSISAARPVISDGGSEESRHRGEAQVGEISISKVVDKSSVYILQSLLKGDVLDKIQIDMTTVEADKSVTVYYTIKGDKARITNFSNSGAGDEGSMASESFSLNCTSLTWTYNYKDPTTKNTVPSTAGFNLDTVVTEPAK
jgi:type VI secretion system secreted protein Hcp